MFGRLIKWGLVIVAAILVYNYFYGTDKERDTSEKIFREVKELGTSVRDALSHEKDRFQQGKYDGLIDQLDGLWENMQSGLSSPEQKEDLKKEKQKLEEELKAYDGKDSSEKARILADLDQFLHRADSILRRNER